MSLYCQNPECGVYLGSMGGDSCSLCGWSEPVDVEDIESATAAPLLERIKTLVSAIDEEMVVSHLGVFNEGDDPAAAIKKLMLWSQGLGEYFAKERIAELEQQLALAQSSLEAARKDAGWRPIETAPKDGTTLLVVPDSGYTQAFWQDGFWWWHNTDDDSLAVGPEPKGWKPLPPPPTDAAISKDKSSN